MESLYERCMKVMPPTAKRATTLGVIKGEGIYLYTDDGRKIIDFASGVAVCNIGHNHPKVVEAAKAQIDKLIHGGHNVVYYESYVKLAEKLVELTGSDTMAYFSNSGAEVNEGALKLAKFVTKRPAIISFKGGFHGRTLAAASITASSSQYRKNYEGMLPSVYFLEYPNLYRTPYEIKDGEDCPEQYFKQFDELFHDLVDPYSVAAIIMEPVQGEGGYIAAPKSFLEYVRKICTKYGIMLIFDEVQTGFGRTGKLFAWQNFNIKPDIFTCAKGIASGFPLGAIIAKKEIMEKWIPGAHGGTFGGNPVSCAASLATIDVLNDGAIENAAKMGEYLNKKLMKLKEKYTFIGDVRGIGLMQALEFVKDRDTKEPDMELTVKIKEKALEKGLLLLTCGTYKNVIRFIAPTIVKKEEMDEALKIFEETLMEIK
ncbi:aspartate aminotransferase family protein [Clostridium sp. BJN0001]|uniref:aspartate aminotransferase family protein n=1 Tax=Clostridium sp. BJN0001 TaxID=2930219 RepID=UPI001FD1F66C|nr:aspartate aminotransferase family protein [Clostridium sp. BJN0001]